MLGFLLCRCKNRRKLQKCFSKFSPVAGAGICQKGKFKATRQTPELETPGLEFKQSVNKASRGFVPVSEFENYGLGDPWDTTMSMSWEPNLSPAVDFTLHKAHLQVNPLSKGFPEYPYFRLAVAFSFLFFHP